MIYFDREEGPVNKIGKIDVIGSNNAEMADKMIYESVCKTTSRARSGIQSTHSEFKLIRFNNGKKTKQEY